MSARYCVTCGSELKQITFVGNFYNPMTGKLISRWKYECPQKPSEPWYKRYFHIVEYLSN